MDEFRRKPVNRVASKVPVPTTPSSSAPHPISAPPEAMQTPPVPTSPITHQSIEDSAAGIDTQKAKKSWKKRIIWSAIGLAVAIVLAIGGIFAWYSIQLSPVNAGDATKKLITIESGSAPAEIAAALKTEGLIRNETAFLWYARLSGTQNSLQAGAYRLAPSESTPEIIGHLSKGRVDTVTITFLPGATVEANKKVLKEAGYTDEEIGAAFAKQYDSPVFAGKPAGADLEGYIYGETYAFGSDASVESILEKTFEQLYGVVQENNLETLYKSHGLSLYEGITLASIIQREASPKADDMPRIAQVFYNRLSQGIMLGSDVTYQYIADKTGVPRSPTLDSPYNTRKYPGLPPGPISAPGEKALLAVANPASGDYLYFLSGDDDVTYFARTLEEHEANIRNHCQEKCQIL